MDKIVGKIHSIETCGTVDGPGIRFVLFMQGCPLRCLYCHNPDTWNINEGSEMSIDEVMTEIKKYKSFMDFSGGGITISGGEPMMQPEFVRELTRRCRENGIHTAIDTSGAIFDENTINALEFTDLLLLDIKNFDKTFYKELTGGNLDTTLSLLQFASKKNIAVWIRYVLVPGLTDNFEYIEKLSDYLSRYSNIKKIEVIPFHKMGEYKWEGLELDYRLKETCEPSPEMIEKVKGTFLHKKHFL